MVKLHVEGDIREQEEAGREPQESQDVVYSGSTPKLAVTGGRRKWLVGGGIVVVAAVILVGFLKSDSLVANASAYQAVFLDNNQVYFGKLTNAASVYPVLTDIFYLRVTQPLQPPKDGAAQPDVNLVKLGTELHGPADEMRINRSHILFVEDLKPDSAVTKAINNFKAYQKQQAGK